MQKDSFFSSLRVVELASVLAGPAVGMFFAELGADVVKIENKTTTGDVTRGWKSPGESADWPISAYWSSVNWGKKLEMLDFSEPKDLEKTFLFLENADIVIANFKPGAAERWGLDADSLRQKFPKLIYAQIDAFPGGTDRPAFDIVLQAEAGFLFMTGEPGRTPVKMPVALIDLLAAHQLKEGILLALLHRAESGKGAIVRTSLLEAALASLANQASNYLMAGHIPQPMGTLHPNIAPYGDIFSCSNGQLIVLAIGTERQFRNLCTTLGLPDLPKDSRFASNSARVQNRESLNQVLQKAISQHTLSDLLAQFQSLGLPAAQIRDMASVFEMPEAQKMILEGEAFGIKTQAVKTVAFTLEAS